MEYIRAKAPLRIGMAGGGTDVDPFASIEGGCVFNTTINKYAYCTLIPRNNDVISVTSTYFGQYKARLRNGPLKLDGNKDLIKAVTNYFEIDHGLDISLYSDVPAGSGLGGSSTMVVAMISAIAEHVNKKMTNYEMADLAYRLEREVIGLKGGKQDQYAAVFGGFNLLDIKEDVKVNPIRIDQDIINELQCRSVMCFTGMSRESAKIIDSQVKTYSSGQNIDALNESKKLAKEMSDAVVNGNLDLVGEILDQSWELKKQFANNISNRHINALYKAAKEKGAIGGKVSGAGGGGFMYFICKYDKKPDVVGGFKKRSVDVTDFMFEPKGVVTWKSNSE